MEFKILFGLGFVSLMLAAGCQSAETTSPASAPVATPVPVDAASYFPDREACFRVVAVSTGQVLQEHNPEFCKARHAPNSTFKIPAALMGFESGLLKDENQVLKWNGVQSDRPETNQDQTPMTWMERSVIWVTQWITARISPAKISRYLKDFNYGNQDFSGGRDKAWLDSSLKISPDEQLVFLKSFWTERLPLAKSTFQRTKKILFIESLRDQVDLYGKTGTGCRESDCGKKTGRGQGWFVGVVQTPSEAYTFVAYAVDNVAQEKPAGPRLRETMTQILGQMENLK